MDGFFKGKFSLGKTKGGYSKVVEAKVMSRLERTNKSLSP